MDPWFKFFASDYLLDEGVDALPLEAQGILVRLWCLAWRDQLLKDDPDTLARRAMVDPKAMRKHWAGLRAFFRETPEGLVSDRMERERSESRGVSESRRLGARLTNEKRWGKRDGERVAGPSLTDRSAIAQRQVERVAQVSLSESESDTEIPPPSGAPKPPEPVKPRRTRRSRVEILTAFPEPVREVVNTLGPEWHRQDPDGRAIDTRPEEFGEAVARILGAQVELTPEVLIAAGRAYLASNRTRYRAPQWFFGVGKPEDPAPWVGYVRGELTRRQREAQPALPLAAGL
jgi:uncharacterized protein YdaU (DUF1376 family)